MSKKKILVCGATGFIGRNIAMALARREDVEVFGTYLDSKPYDIPGVTLRRVDLTVAAEVDRMVCGMDVIIQAAATTSGAKDIVNKPYYHVTDNAVMNSLIFRAAHEHAVPRVLFFSCTVMYQPSDTPLRESDFDANRAIFPSYFGVGWTKVYIEKMCEFYARLGRTRYTAIRHSNIYGPFDKYDLEKSHVFGATVTKAMTAPENGEVVVWGSGEEERDLLHVDDLVDFVMRAMEKQTTAFELYNCGYGSAIAVKDLVQKVIDRSGRKLSIRFDRDKPTIKTRLCLDCGKALAELGWKPRVDLDQGIIRTLAWYRTHIEDGAKT